MIKLERNSNLLCQKCIDSRQSKTKNHD